MTDVIPTWLLVVLGAVFISVFLPAIWEILKDLVLPLFVLLVLVSPFAEKRRRHFELPEEMDGANVGPRRTA